MHSTYTVLATIAVLTAFTLSSPVPGPASPSLTSANFTLPTTVPEVDSAYASFLSALPTVPSGHVSIAWPATPAPTAASAIASFNMMLENLPTKAAQVDAAYSQFVKDQPPIPSGYPSVAWPASLPTGMASSVAAFNRKVPGDSYTGIPDAMVKDLAGRLKGGMAAAKTEVPGVQATGVALSGGLARGL